MDVQACFNRVKMYYQGSFDFTSPFCYDGHEYTALAAFHAHVDKYVFVKKAQVWAADSHEFCLFQIYDHFFGPSDFTDLTHLLTEYIEPQLVRKGETYPEKDHMYTYMTLVILCQQGVTKEMIHMIRHYNYTKYYKLYARGYSEAHVILVDTENKKVYTNRAGHEMKKLYKCIFRDLDKDKSACN